MARWMGEVMSHEARYPDLAQAANALDIPLVEIDSFTDEASRRRFADLELDLGVSLANRYISPRFFSLPGLGMINFHASRLPEYKGSPSTVRELHDRQRTAGFAIHRIDRTLDGGDILLSGEVPIELRPTMRETIIANGIAVREAGMRAVIEVLRDPRRYIAEARPNPGSARFTIPSGREWWRVWRGWRVLRM